MRISVSVIAHYVVYKKLGILHRDLSVNNIMFLRRNDSVIGVLNDWDLAFPAFSSQSFQLPTSYHGAGTAAFMAIDLLKSPDGFIQHQYYYDLESFAWILIWCAFVFCLDGAEVKFGKRPEPIQTWTGETNWTIIRCSKVLFLTDKVNEQLKRVTAAMKSLQTCWIAPVLRNMQTTYFARVSQEADGLVEGDFFQFEAFMKVLEPEVKDPETVLRSDECSVSV